MPVDLRLKIWADGTPEPSAWTATTTDTDPLPGMVPGLYCYRSTGTGTLPFTFDDYRVDTSWGRTIANDTFSRVSETSWGAADVGGAWTATGSLPGKTSTDGNRGLLTLASAGGDMLLTGVSAPSARAQMTYTVGGGPASGGRYVAVLLRVQGATGYRFTAWHRPQGDVWALIQRNGTNIVTQDGVIPTWTEGQRFHIKAECVDPTMFSPRAFIGSTPIIRAYVAGQIAQEGLG